MKKSALLLTLCSLTFAPIMASCNGGNDTPVQPEVPTTNVTVNFEYDESKGAINFEQKEYQIGDKIIFKFTLNKGYAVDKFYVNNKIIDVYQNEATYTLDSLTLNVKCDFVEESTITINYNKEGGIVAIPDTIYKIGDALHISVTENDGYYLAYVKVNGDKIRPNKQREYIYNISSKTVTIEVLFEKISVDLADFTFIFDEENHTAAIKKYSPYRERIPNPFIVPETVTKKGVEYKINHLMAGSLDTSSIRAIEISKNMEIIDDATFGNVHGMTSITVNPENQHFASKDNILFNKDFTKLVAAPTEYLETTYEIPDSVVEVGAHAFLNNRLIKTLTMSDKVVTLNKGSFQSMRSLETVKLSEGITVIPEQCFDNAINLLGVDIPSKVVSIEKWAFNFCPQFRYVNFPQTLKTIGQEAFNHCQKLEELNFNEGLEEIGRSAFGQVEGITKLKFPSTLKSIGTAAFEVCIKLTDVEFNEGLEHLGGAIFAMDTELGDIVLPSTLKTIEFNPFFGNARTKLSIAPGNTNFKVIDGVLYDFDQTRLISFPYALKPENLEYKIPNTVEEICEDAFATNTYLRKLTIPASVKRMYLAFENILPDQGTGAYSLELFYEGTMAQFAAIDSGDQPWNYKANFKNGIVTCSDGVIKL